MLVMTMTMISIVLENANRIIREMRMAGSSATNL